MRAEEETNFGRICLHLDIYKRRNSWFLRETTGNISHHFPTTPGYELIFYSNLVLVFKDLNVIKPFFCPVDKTCRLFQKLFEASNAGVNVSVISTLELDFDLMEPF